MSSTSPDSQEPSGASGISLPSRANGKATPAPPKLSANENVELKDVRAVQSKLPVEDDIMQLARLGEVGAIQKLFESGQFDAKYKDEEGITPLHVRDGSVGHEMWLLSADELYWYAVGGDQQSLCAVQISRRVRGRCQCQRRGVSGNTSHVGSAKVSLLRRELAPAEGSGHSPHGCPGL